MAAKIINCDCTSEYQDKKYGPGKRVANTTEQSARCTVCGKLSASAAKSDKKA